MDLVLFLLQIFFKKFLILIANKAVFGLVHAMHLFTIILLHIVYYKIVAYDMIVVRTLSVFTHPQRRLHEALQVLLRLRLSFINITSKFLLIKASHL